MGKVLAEAKGDVLKAIEVVECACSSHYLMQGDTCMNVAAGYDTVSFREPLGVFVGIAPYNFPAMIPMGWMLPFCITTGNTFVLKAASMVPQTSMRMLELLIEAGLPKGVVNLVTCSRVEADSLLTNPASRASPSSARPRSACTSTRPLPAPASASRRCAKPRTTPW
jgi:malonate-semialdehyde dehydrogenase (acetylating)/methylmalonate-semialdehyde dehydrogenase